MNHQLCGMKAIRVVVPAFLLCWSCASEAPKQAADAKRLFYQNCVFCHGIKGDLMTNGAHNLRLSQMSKEERILVITRGRNAMTGFEGKLSKDDIEKIAEYTISLAQSTSE